MTKLNLSFSLVGQTEYCTFYSDQIRMGKCLLVPNGESVHLFYIELLDEYRGQGYAQQFWMLVEDELCQRGKTQVTLETAEFSDRHNKLVQLYSSWGFKVNGNERYYYSGEDLMRKVPMEKSLSPTKN